MSIVDEFLERCGINGADFSMQHINKKEFVIYLRLAHLFSYGVYSVKSSFPISCYRSNSGDTYISSILNLFYGGDTSYDTRDDSWLSKDIDSNVQSIRKTLEYDEISLYRVLINGQDYYTVYGNGNHRCGYLLAAYIKERIDSLIDPSILEDIEEKYTFPAEIHSFCRDMRISYLIGILNMVLEMRKSPLAMKLSIADGSEESDGKYKIILKDYENDSTEESLSFSSVAKCLELPMVKKHILDTPEFKRLLEECKEGVRPLIKKKNCGYFNTDAENEVIDYLENEGILGDLIKLLREKFLNKDKTTDYEWDR